MIVVTNLPAPYRDEVFRLLQDKVGARIVLLARDEPGRGWLGRSVPYEYQVARGLTLRFRGRSVYLPVPTWLLTRELLLVAGFGPAAMLSVLFAPGRTLLWSEATLRTERGLTGARRRLRAWAVRRCTAAVAAGKLSSEYLRALGAQRVLLLPNVLGSSAEGIDPPQAAPPPTLVHVGRWCEKKGARMASEVWARVKDTETVPGVRFLIVGEVDDWPIPDGAEHLGFLASDWVWPRLMSEGARVNLVLSEFEHWGYSLHEGMSVGVVPIARPHVAAGEELLAASEPPLLVESADEATALAMRLITDDDCWKRLSLECRESAKRVSPELAVSTFLHGVRALFPAP